METLILLLYYQRPEMVKHALRSVAQQTTDRWQLMVLDDSEPNFGHAKLLDAIKGEGLYHKAVVFKTGTHPSVRAHHGGSLVGQTMNAILDSTPCETAIMLCDDDALIPDYIENGQRYFEAHPSEVYAYCHVRIYDPTCEVPGPHLPKRPYFTNREGAVYPSCAVDASQVMWRTKVNKDGMAMFPNFPQTKNLDAFFYHHLGQNYGPGNFMGFDGQYKGIFDDQLGTRKDPYKVTVQ